MLLEWLKSVLTPFECGQRKSENYKGNRILSKDHERGTLYSYKISLVITLKHIGHVTLPIGKVKANTQYFCIE